MANGDVSIRFTLTTASSTLLIAGATTATTVPGATVVSGSSTQTGRPAQ